MAPTMKATKPSKPGGAKEVESVMQELTQFEHDSELLQGLVMRNAIVLG